MTGENGRERAGRREAIRRRWDAVQSERSGAGACVCRQPRESPGTLASYPCHLLADERCSAEPKTLVDAHCARLYFSPLDVCVCVCMLDACVRGSWTVRACVGVGVCLRGGGSTMKINEFWPNYLLAAALVWTLDSRGKNIFSPKKLSRPFHRLVLGINHSYCHE